MPTLERQHFLETKSGVDVMALQIPVAGVYARRMDAKTEQTKSRIRQAIAAAGMSQGQFADKAGYTRSTFSNIVSPESKRAIQVADLERIAKALGRPISYFTDGPDTGNEREIAVSPPPSQIAGLTLEEQALIIMVRNSGIPIGEVMRRVIGFPLGPVRPIASGDNSQGRLDYKSGEGA